MHTEEAYRWRKQAAWGLMLMAAGTVLLLDRQDLIDAASWWRYWPLALVLVGINQAIGVPSARDFGNGLWIIFVGLWLFACFENLFGLTFRNSWPLFLLAGGLKLVLEPLVERRLAQRFVQDREPRHEK